MLKIILLIIQAHTAAHEIAQPAPAQIVTIQAKPATEPEKMTTCHISENGSCWSAR